MSNQNTQLFNPSTTNPRWCFSASSTPKQRSVVECFAAFSSEFPSVASGLASPVNIWTVPQRVALGDGPGPPD